MQLLTQHLVCDNYNFHTDKTLQVFLDKSEPPVKIGREGREMRYQSGKKAIIVDNDGVTNRFNTPSTAENYVEDITDKNSYLRSKKKQVFFDFKMLESTEDPGPHRDSLSYHFRKGELTYRQHIDACDRAAQNLQMVQRYNWGINRLYDMAYRVFMLTGSPQELLERCSNKLGIGMENIEPSKFYFDSRGIFERMELNIDSTRSDRRDAIMEQTVFSRHGFEIMVDNNPVSGKRIAKSGWNRFYLWASKDVPILSDSISVEAFEIRHDFGKLVDRIKRLERGLQVVLTMSEEEHKDAIALAHRAMEYGNLALESSGTEFEKNFNSFATYARRHVKQMGGIFPSRQTQIFTRIKSAENERNELEAKLKLKETMEVFFDNSFEVKMD